MNPKTLQKIQALHEILEREAQTKEGEKKKFRVLSMPTSL